MKFLTNKNSVNTKPISLIIIIFSLAIFSATAQRAMAQDSDAPQQQAASSGKSPDTKTSLKSEFNKLVRQRDSLHKDLQTLDAKALKSVKADQNPVDIYAEQISIQDKLDLLNLRLEMLSLRADMEIPPLPQSKSEKRKTFQDEGENESTQINEFNRATQRTLNKLRIQTMQMLSQLNMDAFLADNGRN